MGIVKLDFGSMVGTSLEAKPVLPLRKDVGVLFYEKDTYDWYVWTVNLKWELFSSGGPSTGGGILPKRYDSTATAGQIAIALGEPVHPQAIVLINGAVLPVDSYTVSGSTITVGTLSANDQISVINYIDSQGGSSTISVEESFMAAAGQTDFTVDDNIVAANVFVNGARLLQTDYTTSGKTVTLNQALSVNDEVIIVNNI